MSKQTINVGIDPGGQGDGDVHRVAWIKSNSNFDELYGEVFPSTNPDISISLLPSLILREEGDDVINPQVTGKAELGTNPLGTLTLMEFFRGSTSDILIGTQTNPNSNTDYSKTDSFTVSNEQTYTVKITDSEGRTDTNNNIYKFTLPTFGTSTDITVMTKQTLRTNNQSYYPIDMVAEDGTDKQTFDYPTDWANITGIQWYNTISSTWEWLNGSKLNSMDDFSQTTTTYDIQGNTTSYNRFTHTGAFIGARQLRFYR